MAQSFSNKISNILCSAPENFDSEDEADDTNARVTSEPLDTFEDENVVSNLRKQNAALLENEDNRYFGKPESRDQIFDKNEWEGESDEEIEDSDSASESVPSSENDEGDESSEQEYESEEDADDEQQFKQLEDSSDQRNKGTSVRRQLNLWENFLEIRIQLQKCVLTANKLPQSDHFNELSDTCGHKFTNSVQQSRKNIQGVLDKLLQLQSLLLQKYPETKNLLSENKGDTKNLDSDEEIQSDTENETSDCEEPSKKKFKLNEYSEEIRKRHHLYKDYRNSVINKWNDKTRIASSKPGQVGQSVVNQIEHILGDKQRLIKRTQQKRMDYEILGEVQDDSSSENHLEPKYNANIFDDTDFYHQLLRELIEFKSSDITDPIQLGQQWIKLQNMRSKMKRKIDSSATKGRKIKYAIHSKLVNFMAPIEQMTWQDNAKSELYNSLFGKNCMESKTDVQIC